MQLLRPAAAFGGLLALCGGLLGCSGSLQLLSVTAVTPSSIVASTAPTLITLTGTQFNRSMSMTLNGFPQPTTFVSSTQLTSAAPANLPIGSYSIAILDSEGSLAGSAMLPTSFVLQVTAK